MKKIKEDDGIIVVFEDMKGYFDFVQAKGLVLLSDETRKFVDSYSTIGSGCGCTRGARMKRVEALYLSIPKSLDAHRIYLLGRVFSEREEKPVKKIVFKHNGSKFDEIDFEINP
tara:strand:+ start:271 stop:612 length:342 start_codon:yes stop_codon:yes gene_type:complete